MRIVILFILGVALAGATGCASPAAADVPFAAPDLSFLTGDPVEAEKAQIRASMRPWLERGDLSAIEARYDAYSEAPEDKAKGYLLSRTLFLMFATSDPKMFDLAERWVAQYPESPHAHTALAWAYWKRGWLMRGQAAIRETYPAARSAAMERFRSSVEHSQAALAVDPGHVAASDVLLLSGMHVNAGKSAGEIAEVVMALAPNRGTLVKAGIASGPKWGGSWGQIVALCEAHASKVPDVPDYTLDICKAELAYQAYNSARDRASVDEIVQTSDHPILEGARIQRILSTEDTSETARRLLEAYLFDVTVTDTDAAGYLDAYFYRKEKRPLVTFDVWSRRMAKARADLQYDPYDGDIISILMMTDVNRRDLAPALTQADKRGLHSRALMLAPYDPGHWIGLAFATGADTDPLAADRFFENAAVFSNFAPYYIGYYADHKAGQYVNLTYARKDLDGTFAGVPAEDYDREADEILCPFVRAALLWRAQCGPEADGSADCSMRFNMEVWTDVANAASKYPACNAHFDAPIETLAFKPHLVDVSAFLTE